MFRKKSFTPILPFLLALGMCTLQAKPSEPEVIKSPILISDYNFKTKVLEADKPFIVVFAAKWCGSYQKYNTIINGIAGKYAGKVVVGVLDIDKNPKKRVKYNITFYPTTLIFSNGRIVKKLSGSKSRRKLEKVIDALLQEDEKVSKSEATE